MNPKVKICGLTRNLDARMAEAEGAWALGLIFAESRRQIDLEQARVVLSGIGSEVKRVGVFSNQSAELIKKCVDELGLHLIQLHGSESTEFARSLLRWKNDLGIIKVFTSPQLEDLQEMEKFECDYLLFDSSKDKKQKLDVMNLTRIKPSKPLFLAGGLNPSNVGECIKALKPFAVDVASGIESEVGCKDPILMRSFFRSVEEYRYE